MGFPLDQTREHPSCAAMFRLVKQDKTDFGEEFKKNQAGEKRKNSEIKTKSKQWRWTENQFNPRF